jgi:yeast amino acid transporter
LAAYITIPIFLALYFGHKIYWATFQVTKGEAMHKNGSTVQRWFAVFSKFGLRTHEIDCVTGKQEMDELEAMDEPPVAKNWLQKVCPRTSPEFLANC